MKGAFEVGEVSRFANEFAPPPLGFRIHRFQINWIASQKQAGPRCGNIRRIGFWLRRFSLRICETMANWAAIQ